jgi:RecB family endonuclease NucS
MPEPIRILAGDCTVTYEDADETRRERGNMLTITKPDNC